MTITRERFNKLVDELETVVRTEGGIAMYELLEKALTQDGIVKIEDKGD